jgi:uncharacterized membrane protein SirB2
MPLSNLDPQETARWVTLLIVALLQYILLGYVQYLSERKDVDNNYYGDLEPETLD